MNKFAFAAATSIFALSTANACEKYPLVRADLSAAPRGTALEAGEFAESIGVVFKFGDEKYYTSWARQRLEEIGIKHIRGSLRSGAKHADFLQSLNKELGIKFTLLVNAYPNNPQTMTPDEAVEAIKKIGPDILDGVEGPNEPEYFCNSGNCAQLVRDFQRGLYAAIKGDQQTADVMVFGPSISATGVAGGMANSIGKIASEIDSVNVHAYAHIGGGYSSPEQDAGTLLGSLKAQHIMGDPNQPMVSTETGYPTQAEHPPFPDPNGTKAIYMPRLYTTLFTHGMWRAYSYAFIDANTGGSDKENNFGYLESDGTPKPSFDTVKTLVGLMTDSGGRVNPINLDYKITGNTKDINDALFQKSDGTYLLGLWVAKERDPKNPIKQSIAVTGIGENASLITLDGEETSVSTSSIPVTESMAFLKFQGQTPQSCDIGSGTNKPINSSSNNNSTTTKRFQSYQECVQQTIKKAIDSSNKSQINFELLQKQLENCNIDSSDIRSGGLQ